jgi:hypothetical protein
VVADGPHDGCGGPGDPASASEETRKEEKEGGHRNTVAPLAGRSDRSGGGVECCSLG